MNQQAEKLRLYAQENVVFLLQKLMEDILAQQPKNVIDWSIAWLDKKGRDIVKSRQKQNAHSSSSDDEVIELPKRPVAARKQRASISAEAYGQYNRKESFQPRVIVKTQQQKEKIGKRLEQSFMFASLDQKEKDIVIDAMEERSYNAEDWVIKQGDNGDNLYVVDQGELNCYKRFTKDGENKFLKVYYPGESFGELALLYNAPRAASIPGQNQFCLVCIRQINIQSHCQGCSNEREKYVNVLKQIELLSMMDPYERSHVADAIRSAVFQKGDYVIREGEQGDIFYMIEEGELIATKTLIQGQEPTKVFQYKAGDYFGELALLKDIPRQANVVAETEVKLIYLDRHSFKRMLGPLEDILKRNTEKYEKYEQYWINQGK
uniref:cAMP-dependent protein kinase, regulatory subunit 1-4 n=2 Tax=Paramecium tetraurelia TaxID=5888 RepID=Q3SDZ1_PARTE|nr:cAMP-dependent protein kinase, regulatory subunit 1-4 [Paramecium tetraurelia]